jgi:hypothetical protein
MKELSKFAKGIEVSSRIVWALINGMGVYKHKGFKIFEKLGLKEINYDLNQWYSWELFHEAFKLIENEIGFEAIFRIGTKIPENANIPHNTDSVESSLKSIDIAYHMNHRNSKKQILFDKNRTPNKLLNDNIGSSIYENGPKPKTALIHCNNPYPCDFDMGLINGFARKFTDDVVVEHQDISKCRKNGNNECIYSVRWK